MSFSENDPSLQIDESDTMQLIRQAVLFENLELICDLVKENPWIVWRTDRHGRTPLMMAAHNGRANSINALLDTTPGILDVSNSQGKTALHLAAEAGELAAVRVLLSAGADPSRRDGTGHCALEAAHIGGHDSVAAIIIESIQYQSDKIHEAHILLIEACAEGNTDAVKSIVSSTSVQDLDLLLNGRFPEDVTAMFISCTNGQSDVVRQLLEFKDKHVLVNQQTKDTVLHAAISSQNVEVLQLVLQAYPALISNSNCDGCSCLHWAAESGSTAIVKCLLEYDFSSQYIKDIDMVSFPPYRLAIDVNQGDSECRTALYRAVAKGHIEVLQYMLEFCCQFTDKIRRCPFQLDVYCSKGRTPLMVAAYNQNLPILTLLLDNGADINLPLAILDSEVNGEEVRCVGSGALVEATRADAIHIVHFLLDKGALDTDNRALSLASSNNNMKLIRVFLTRLVFPDPEYKVNKRNVDVGQIQVGQSLLPSSLCPSRAAMLNWCSAGLNSIHSDWFIGAALQVNPRLRTTRFSLAAITRVDLSCNRLMVFPTVLFQMPSLRSLNISENKITSISLPSFYISSTSLEILNIRHNKLETFTLQLLASLPKLTLLDISHNCLTELPEFIWLCPALKELNVSHNLLCSLPMVGGGRDGRTLKLQQGLAPNGTDNATLRDASFEDPENVTQKPLLRQNIWQTSINLSKVDDDHLFPDFPVTSSNTLTTLNLSDNRFQSFPLCLSCTCPRLVTLNIANNQISSLPPICCIPAHLRNLDVSRNILKDSFQPSTSCHVACHAVPPSKNAGGVVRRPNSPVRNHRSRSKSAVRSQRSLSVSRHQTSDTQLEEACLHKRHDTLEWLKTLNISTNCLTSFEVCASGKVLFPSLTTLDMCCNRLKVIPSNLSRINGLSVLNLSENKDIHELPPELGMLSRLWSLSVKGCRLKDPLDSMINIENCKTVEIVAYLKTILEESKTYRHLRLLILGEDGVGKSLLWESLKGEAIQKRHASQTENIRVAKWKFEAKRLKGGLSTGPIGFTAWDFCGQREYHATHQYFLTRRTLYLVVWRITDDELALINVRKWLVNVQTRAPNSSVILVATHVDHVTSNPNKFPSGFLENVEAKVKSRFMISDADKRGLPRVIDLLFVSTKSKHDIKMLLTVIYKCAWEVRIGKERALDQQIPSSYVALMKVVQEMISEFRKDCSSSILTFEQFKMITNQRMATEYGRPFRDDIEFHGACSFLHDSGEIIHFEDAALRHLVFVDPLWLCDYLAAVVALRSPKQPAGLLSQDALIPLFKQFKSADSTPFRSVLDLLHKFELALTCHLRHLMISSLLPDEYQLRADYPNSCVKVPTKMLSWGIRSSQRSLLFRLPNVVGQRISSGETNVSNEKVVSQRCTDVILTFAYNKIRQLRRIYVISYIPTGFWSRLITRIIGDQNVSHAIEEIFIAQNKENVTLLKDISDGHLKAEWMIWQTGIEMLVKGHSLFVLKQFFSQAEVRDINYSSLEIRARDEQKRWKTFPLGEWDVIEMLFPSLSITAVMDSEKIMMQTDMEGASRLLALIVDLVDTLLEDWYPSLGTRFVHTSEGDLLVNRFVPCTNCAHLADSSERRSHDDTDIDVRKDSLSNVRGSKTTGDIRSMGIVHCFSIEECMLAGREYGWLECPSHGGVHMRDIAPDTVFLDIEGSLKITGENIRRGRMLGRGAFGFVFRANIKMMNGELCEVAQKMLEPVVPGPGGRPSAIAAYKAVADKWRRDSLEFACRAYCTSRQELNLLSRMRHSNVIGLVGVCISPLSLIVELAPLGALNQMLASYRKSGARLALSVIKDSTMQVAKALEYLHSAHIIYRDLKSENVLVWHFPHPFSVHLDVLLKLGDYGISRSVLPSGGAKGFGGTEGFMAPEIVRFNGEEEYTQKVDCFSFGMFLYELITLKLPFEGEEHVKERLLEGARPVLLPYELLFPSSMLDLLVHCWSTHPDSRPSSSQLVGYCSAPEFTHVLDVCELEESHPPFSILPIPTTDMELDDPDDFEAQLWLNGRDITVMSCTQFGWIDRKCIASPTHVRFTSHIRDTIWSCDEFGRVIVFASSLHELSTLQLPIHNTILIRPPMLIGTDVILVVGERQLQLLRLNEFNSVVPLGTMDSPFPIRTATFVQQSNSRQIWTGHADGRISIHYLSQDDKFSFSSSLYLPNIETSIREIVTSRDGANVWISVEGGSCVFCWDVERRQIAASLDIKKVMPGSETIHTLDVDFSSNNYVTATCLLERSDCQHLYIGTNKGLLVITNALLMQPLSACRPYMGELSFICVVEGPKEDDINLKARTTLSSTSSESGLGWVRERMTETMDRIRGSPALICSHGTSVVVTVGKQYRSLSYRFVSGEQLSDNYSTVIWRTDDWV